MAQRPVFESTINAPYYKVHYPEFTFYSGFSISQKQKSINSLHSSFKSSNPDKSILEISTKSCEAIGVALSAFNLKLHHANRAVSVECAFQSSKVFENGGPYTDLLYKTSLEAKRDERLRASGQITNFKYQGIEYPLTPTTYFYNWLYINALAQNKTLANSLCNYDAFTDFEFNEKKSINCQAMAAAIYVGLYKAGLLDAALNNRTSFLEIVYNIKK